MPLYMRLQARAEGDPGDHAAEARRLGAAYPNDPLVAIVEAEAEWVARNFAAASLAADRAIKLTPNSSEAHIWKGRAVLSQAKAKEAGVTFADARGWFSRANKLDPENPEPLHYFYLAYRLAGTQPTANAIAALHYAAELAPHDMGLRLQSAREHLRAGDTAKAKRQLVPVAYNPHDGRAADTAREMIRLIDARDTASAESLVQDED
jgi:tetratricopeptide (TPR) repeat protein